LNNNKK